MSRNLVAGLTLLFALCLPAGRAAVAATTCVTLTSSSAELDVCRDTNGGGKARLYLSELRNLATGAAIDLGNSPLWQLEAREWKDALGESTRADCTVPSVPIFACPTPIMLPPDASSGGFEADRVPVKLWHDESLVTLSGNSTSATLIWQGLVNQAFPDDTLDVQVTIAVEGDLFNFDIELEAVPLAGSGSKGLVRAVRFPYLVVTSVGTVPADDHLIVPHAGGWDLDNPYQYGQFVSTAGMLDDDSFSASGMDYPGTMNMQFVGLYDGEGSDDGGSGLGGIVLFARDAMGNLKRIWGHRARLPDESPAVKLYLKHYNLAPERSSLSEARQAFRSFNLGGRLGYEVALAAYPGDWFDALKRYEAWARQDSNVVTSGFLRKGLLTSRTDIPAPYLNSAVLFSHNLTRGDAWPRTVHDDVDDLADAVEFILQGLPEAALGKTIRADTSFGFLAGSSTIWEQSCLESHMPAGDWGYLGKSCFRKADVRTYIEELRARLDGVAGPTIFMQNTDTGSVPASQSTLVADIHERKRFDRKICAISDTLQPSHRGGSIYDTSDNEHLSCNGSRKTRRSRTKTLKDIYRLSRPPGGHGFDFWMLSGQGSVSKACFAPVSPNVSGTHRRHVIGGGNTQLDGFATFVEEFSRKQQKRNPQTFYAFEREHEQLIPLGIAGGHGSHFPYYEPASRTPKAVGGDPLPLTSLAFHDYKLIGEEINFTQGIFFWHQDATSSNPITTRYQNDWNYPHLRLWMVQALVWGRALTYNVASTCWQGAAGSGTICPDGYGPPGRIDTARRGRLWDWQFLRQAARARRIFQDYLVYGEALKPPRLSGGTDFYAKIPSPPSPLRPDIPLWRDVPKVWASAWRAPDSSIGIVAANFWIAEPGAPEQSNATGQASSVVLTFIPSEWGLDSGTFTIERFNHATLQWEPFDTVTGGSTPYTSPPTDIPPVVDPATWQVVNPVKNLADNEDAILVLRISP